MKFAYDEKYLFVLFQWESLHRSLYVKRFRKLTHVDIKFYNFLAIFYTRRQQVHSDWAKLFFINTVKNKSYKITALFNTVVS